MQASHPPHWGYQIMMKNTVLDPQLIESANVMPRDTEDQLYILKEIHVEVDPCSSNPRCSRTSGMHILKVSSICLGWSAAHWVLHTFSFDYNHPKEGLYFLLHYFKWQLLTYVDTKHSFFLALTMHWGYCVLLEVTGAALNRSDRQYSPIALPYCRKKRGGANLRSLLRLFLLLSSLLSGWLIMSKLLPSLSLFIRL